MKTFPKPCAVKGFDPSPKHVKNPCRLLGFGPVNTTHGPRRCRWQARCFVRPGGLPNEIQNFPFKEGRPNTILPILPIP